MIVPSYLVFVCATILFLTAFAMYRSLKRYGDASPIARFIAFTAGAIAATGLVMMILGICLFL